MQHSRGTTIVSIDSIDAEEVLTLDSDADIFQYDGSTKLILLGLKN